MSQYRQKQKSLLIDPSGILQFNVANQNIRMKKIKTVPSETNININPNTLQTNSKRSNSISVSQKVYYSIVQKQSQTGVSFNNRLFFLKDQDVFGYMSKLESNFDIKNAKQKVPLKNLRKCNPKGKMLTLVFQATKIESSGSKNVEKAEEKKWVFRMKDKKMADAWTDIINYQVAQLPSRKNTLDSPYINSQQGFRSRQQSLKNNNKSEIQQNFSQRSLDNKSKAMSTKKENNQKRSSYKDEPIANERPQQNYLSVYIDQQSPQSKLKSPGNKSPKHQLQKQKSSIKSSPKVHNNSSPSSRNSSTHNFSPQNLAAKTHQKQEQQQQSPFNSTSQKHSTKKQRYINSQNKFLYHYNSQFIAQKTYYQQVIESFKTKNQQIKQKLIFPSFMNYFRPYLNNISEQFDYGVLKNNQSTNNQTNNNKFTSDSKDFTKKAQQIDKKYSQFVSYCEITAKQLIDDSDKLSDFRLSNKYYSEQQNLAKDRLIKQMEDKYQNIFGKYPTEKLQIQALFLLFDNILYVDLDDIEIIIPLTELKTLPSYGKMDKTALQSDINSSSNKICQTSLLKEFQNKQKNLSFIYDRLINNPTLQEYFFIPMTCQVLYKGFNIFFKTKSDQNMLKATLTNFYDSTRQIKSLKKNITQKKAIQKQQMSSSFSLQKLHLQLANTLYVFPQVIQNQNLFKIKTINLSQNIANKNNNNKLKKSQAGQTGKNIIPLPTIVENLSNQKYIIQFCDILPYVSMNNSSISISDVVFECVHKGQTNAIDQVNNAYSNPFEFKNRFNLAQGKNNQLTNRFTLQQSQNSLNKTLSRKVQSTIKASSKMNFYNHQAPVKQNQKHQKIYKQFIQQKIKQVAQKLDRYDNPIIHTFQLNQLLTINGLTFESLGKIYKQISGKNSFIKFIIKTQIAAQCTKIIIFKKIQQIFLTSQSSPQAQTYQKIRSQLAQKSIVTFLNLIVSSKQKKQSQLIWKVLDLHSQVLCNCSLSSQQIHKGYFILSLVSKLNIIINPNTDSIENIFKIPKFINSIKFQTSQSQPPKIYENTLRFIYFSDQQTLQKLQPILCNKIITYFNLKNDIFPYFIKKSKILHSKILFILTQSISPLDLTFNHLNLYQSRSLNFSQTQSKIPNLQNLQTHKFSFVQTLNKIKQKDLNIRRQISKDNFNRYYNRKIKQFEFQIKQSPTFATQLLIEKNIETIINQIKIFYQYHPIVSKLLNFLSTFYMSHQFFDFNKSLDYSKKSISSYISLCQGNSNHIKLADVFVNISLLYEKVGKYQQSINQLKRAKHCLQGNRQTETLYYSQILIKLAKLTYAITQAHNNDSIFLKKQQILVYLNNAKKIIQKSQLTIYQNIDLLISAFQLQNQCLNRQEQLNPNSARKLKDISMDPQTRSEHLIYILELILKKDFEIKESHIGCFENDNKYLTKQFQRLLKLILPFYFGSLSQNGSHMLMAYFCELSQSISKKGGINYNNPESQNDNKTQLNHNNSQNLSNPQHFPSSSLSYNIYQAFAYLKNLLLEGAFILDLFSIIQNAQQILLQIRQQIQISLQNKQALSQASSRMYLMSSKGDSIDPILSSQIRQTSKQQQSAIELQNLLDSQRSSIGNNKKKQTHKKFNSVMKSLMTILGEGFMLHIFQE